MKLHDLKPNEGKTKSAKRVGRGISAGQGKTAGRGTKGQKSRSGGGVGLYHQGGNLPFYRKLPFKRGFTPPNQVSYNEVNLDDLSVFPAGSVVDLETMDKARLLRKEGWPVVVLGRGNVEVALTVKANRFSKNAKSKIEAAGGSIEVIE
jgi:large subunit ribosomal protein L15